MTDVNFLSPVFSSYFLDVGYGKLREIIHFHGGLIFSKRTKVILLANITEDSSSRDMEAEVRSIFEYLKQLKNRYFTDMPENLLFQPMLVSEWTDFPSRLSTGSQVFDKQAYVVRNGELMK